ncbi:hypothetical protein K435DRAFT_778718 [Dendrothele bispora CBS 962.96]|uniref:Uncharacterized protein n=1 Tax=Dendrothele bispora (strain CBS 962.96) TaxID=1314807 RepID=A0A4S8M1W1_DENBC|nr:hypothetical protein K435DRAFT_778718 [Dendrothele bispora CBS 962.96]
MSLYSLHWRDYPCRHHLRYLSKLVLGQDVPRIAVSNRKDNVTLSVRFLQQPQSTYADLLYFKRRFT